MKGLCIFFSTVFLKIYIGETSVCENEVCKETAKRILDAMDPSINPCDDFYEYSCGSFIKNTPIPHDKVSVGTQTKLSDLLEKQQSEMFIKTLTDKTEPLCITYLRRYFELCMDVGTIDKAGLGTAINTIRLAGYWPMMDKNWKSSSWNYMEAEHNLTNVLNGYGILLAVIVTEDVVNRDRRLIMIDEPDMEMREFLIRGRGDSVVEGYFQFMKDIMTELGADMDLVIPSLDDILEFRIELAKIVGDTNEKRNIKRYGNVMSLRQIQKEWPWLDWTTFLIGIMPKEIPLLRDEQIVIRFPEYITELGRLMGKYPKKIVADYMMWSAFVSLLPYLTSNIQQIKHKLNVVKLGPHDLPSRLAKCLAISKKAYEVAFSALYARNYFNETSKTKAKDMVENIRIEAMKIIKEVKWMDNKTKERAILKATKVRELIAFPEELMDNAELNLYHKDLKMNSDVFLEVNFDLMKWHKIRHWNLLRQRPTDKDWFEHVFVTEVNAAYNPLHNYIVLPAAVLQPPFFHADLPWYYNYAVIGTVIGHEITHGFDDQGRNFDEVGRMRNWWDEESKANFNKQKQCIIDQYSEFNDTKNTNLKLNGVTGQGENIADNGAIRLTHGAYRSKGRSPESKLPGFETFTDEQMMFLSFANLWCVSQRKENMKYLIVSAKHALPEFRVKGSIMNFPQFANAFGCHKGDFMNPDKKCRVW